VTLHIATLQLQALETVVGLSVIRVITAGPLNAQQENQDDNSTTPAPEKKSVFGWLRPQKAEVQPKKQKQERENKEVVPAGPDTLFNYSPAVSDAEWVCYGTVWVQYGRLPYSTGEWATRA
jgi:hypothetical protein